jgi:hypothetical protein
MGSVNASASRNHLTIYVRLIPSDVKSTIVGRWKIGGGCHLVCRNCKLFRVKDLFLRANKSPIKRQIAGAMLSAINPISEDSPLMPKAVFEMDSTCLEVKVMASRGTFDVESRGVIVIDEPSAMVCIVIDEDVGRTQSACTNGANPIIKAASTKAITLPGLSVKTMFHFRNRHL